MQIVPGVLFKFAWTSLPVNWQIRIASDGDVDLLPAKLAAIEGWFERYVNGDAAVVNVVNEVVDSFR